MNKFLSGLKWSHPVEDATVPQSFASTPPREKNSPFNNKAFFVHWWETGEENVRRAETKITRIFFLTSATNNKIANYSQSEFLLLILHDTIWGFYSFIFPLLTFPSCSHWFFYFFFRSLAELIWRVIKTFAIKLANIQAFVGGVVVFKLKANPRAQFGGRADGAFGEST